MTDRRELYRKRRASRRSKKPSRQAAYVLKVLAVFVVAFAALCSYIKAVDKPSAGIGTPSEELRKVEIPEETPEIMVDYEGFTVSFNPARHVPNYVVWELTAEKAGGSIRRKSSFQADGDVYGCPSLDDYRNSGFDRGHMAPAGDMKWSAEAMAHSHYLTNICPQDHSLNGGVWASLENKCREWAKRDSALVIVCGPVLSDRITRTIGRSEVAVPERFFKVVLAPYANPPRAIGFIMANGHVEGGMQAAAVSVDEVETITGFDFFKAVPDEIEDKIESEANFNRWQRLD